MFMTPRKSLSVRLVLLISGWLTLALLGTAVLVMAFVQNTAERELRALLLAHAYNIMGAAEVGKDGSLTANPQISEPRFSRPASGWYWAIVLAQMPQKPVATSASLAGDTIPDILNPDVPFDASFQRIVRSNVSGQLEERLEAQVYLGETETLYTVIVAANRSVVTTSVREIAIMLAMTFSLLVFGTVIVTLFAVRKGLQPLLHVREAVKAMRGGSQVEVTQDVPTEIAPLVDEINALSAANRATLQRARHQVGNLAHAMKTPLAAAFNEVATLEEPKRENLHRQLSRMQSQMTSYLDRAQRGAVRENANHHTVVEPVLNSVIRVLEKLNPDISFDILAENSGLAVRCEGDDLAELLGTIIENAARHAKRRVSATVAVSRESDSLVSITISDDGDGLSGSQKQDVLARGKRLDVSEAGSGLGLSIVQEISEDYFGNLTLGDSETGGLQVNVVLPRSTS